MNHTNGSLPVVAGVDGSAAALHAALWAVEEAVARNVPLRLVYVTKPTHVGAEDYYADVHRGKAALQEARDAVEASGKTVTVETALIDGPPSPALIAESSEAEMICVGTVGIGRYARSILGSTATDLAEKALCPVAVIRPPSAEDRGDVDWIIVAVNDQAGNDAVVDQAMQEAALRHAPVLALGDAEADVSGHRLDEEVQDLRQRHPDVHIYPITNRADVTHFLKKHRERVQLAVIGGMQAGEVAQIVGRFGHPLFQHASSSALVVRP